MENNQKYIIRCDRAGVFFAEIAERRGSEADLVDARRIWYWDGACSCSQIAVDGINDKSKVSVSVPSMTVLGVIEILPCTPKSVESISGQKEWKR